MLEGDGFVGLARSMEVKLVALRLGIGPELICRAGDQRRLVQMAVELVLLGQLGLLLLELHGVVLVRLLSNAVGLSNSLEDGVLEARLELDKLRREQKLIRIALEQLLAPAGQVKELDLVVEVVQIVVAELGCLGKRGG